MADFIAACTQSPVNLTLSVLLALTMAYWLVVLVGAAGLDSLDFDLDLDADVDVDVDANSSGFLATGAAASIFKFFHVGTVPILVLWSVFVLSLWALGVVSWPLVGSWGVLLQLAAVAPLAIGGLMLTKVLTLPLKSIFDRIERDTEAENNVQLLGRRCTIVSLTADARFGQAEIATSGSPLKLHVRTRDADTVLNKGEEAVLVGEDKEARIYYVQRF